MLVVRVGSGWDLYDLDLGSHVCRVGSVRSRPCVHNKSQRPLLWDLDDLRRSCSVLLVEASMGLGGSKMEAFMAQGETSTCCGAGVEYSPLLPPTEASTTASGRKFHKLRSCYHTHTYLEPIVV